MEKDLLDTFTSADKIISDLKHSVRYYFESDITLQRAGSRQVTVPLNDLISCLHLNRSRCDVADHSAQAWANILGKQFTCFYFDYSSATEYLKSRYISRNRFRASYYEHAESLEREVKENYEPKDTAVTVEIIPGTEIATVYVHRGYPGEQFPILYKTNTSAKLEQPAAFTYDSLNQLVLNDLPQRIEQHFHAHSPHQRGSYTELLNSIAAGLLVASHSGRRTTSTSLGIFLAK